MEVLEVYETVTEINLEYVEYLISYIGFGLNIFIFLISFYVGYKIGGAN